MNRKTGIWRSVGPKKSERLSDEEVKVVRRALKKGKNSPSQQSLRMEKSSIRFFTRKGTGRTERIKKEKRAGESRHRKKRKGDPPKRKAFAAAYGRKGCRRREAGERAGKTEKKKICCDRVLLGERRVGRADMEKK